LNSKQSAVKNFIVKAAAGKNRKTSIEKNRKVSDKAWKIQKDWGREKKLLPWWEKLYKAANKVL